MLHLYVCLRIRIRSGLHKILSILFIAFCNLISLWICRLPKRLKCIIVHFVELIGNHGIVQITRYWWHCGSLLNIPYHVYCQWRINCYCLWRIIVTVYDISISKPFWGKTDSTDLWVMNWLTKYCHLVDFRLLIKGLGPLALNILT